MRILMMTDYFPPHLGGGVERVTEELARGLVRLGHAVAVLTLKTCPAPEVEREGLLYVHRTAAIDLTRFTGVQLAVSARLLLDARRIRREFQPDIIHAHNLFFRSTEIAALLKRDRIPLVTTLHLGKAEGGGAFLNTLVRIYEATAGRFIIRRSERVIAVSSAVAAHAIRIAGKATPVTVIPNGVDGALFYPAPAGYNPGKMVLFVGRMVPNKGPEVLLRAIPLVLMRHPQARFVLAGDGPLRHRLEAVARKLAIKDAVDFLGLRRDVPELMRQASIYVRPSYLEGMPLTVLEAMASGLPVVATPVGGTPDLLKDGVHGYLCPVGDPAALAAAISQVLDDPEGAAQMGRRGRELIESGYTWDAVVKQTERVYTEVLKQARKESRAHE